MRSIAGACVVLGAVGALWASACTLEPPVPTDPPAGDDGGVTRSDAGEDAGSSPDAGQGEDAGDAGLDGGDEDAGLEADAGAPDAGCTWDAGEPLNVLPNPSFECGAETPAAPSGWTTGLGTQLASDDATVRTGERSARVSTANAVSFMGLFPSQSPTSGVGARRFCAEAWVLAAPGLNARLSIRALTGGGGAQDESFTAPMNGDWQRLHVTQVTLATHDQVTVRVGIPDAVAGSELFVDDVALWESPDGGCVR